MAELSWAFPADENYASELDNSSMNSEWEAKFRLDEDVTKMGNYGFLSRTQILCSSGDGYFEKRYIIRWHI
jgi:hypothetical protein